LLGDPGEHPDQVGKPVQIRQEVLSTEQSLGLEGDCAALCPTDDRAGKLEGSARPRLARDDELAGHLDPLLEVDDEGRQRLDHRRRDAGLAILEPIDRGGCRCQLGADHEQLTLEAEDQLGDRCESWAERAVLALDAELGARQAERGDRLVNRAVGLGPKIVLADPWAAVQQARRAVVPPAGADDRVDPIHPG
jgi:hypothetical protein